MNEVKCEVIMIKFWSKFCLKMKFVEISKIGRDTMMHLKTSEVKLKVKDALRSF
jgi:hypothetical protein